MSRVLCIDDNRFQSRSLADALARIGHTPIVAADLDEALQILSRQSVDLVISGAGSGDDGNGDLARLLRENGHEVPVLSTTPPESAKDSPAPTDRRDFIRMPLRFEALQAAIDDALRACGLPSAPDRDDAATRVVGESAAIRTVLEAVETIAPTRATVLVQGESGTGKELLVRAIHEKSPRNGKPFVAVNCAALPEGLVESTLFGHERGAFTGASTRFIGAFEQAHTGTLLLDEVSEMRLDLQAKLLRAIQERQIQRVGGSALIPVDVRVIATTNCDLKALVDQGKFRADLYYRLRVLPVTVPPLRERAEDIPLLVRHFVARTARDLGVEPPEVAEETLRVLMHREWPGNVRELEHAVERAVILNRTGPLLPADFPLDGERTSRRAASSEGNAGGRTDFSTAEDAEEEIFNLKVLEERAIQRALAATGGHRTRAAKLLGISDRTLRNRLNRGPRIQPAPAAAAETLSAATGTFFRSSAAETERRAA